METAWVFTNKEYGWVSVDDTEFVSIQESMYGSDEMTFIYKGQEFNSNIVLGSQPG